MSFLSRVALVFAPFVAVACVADPTEPTASSGQGMTDAWFAAHLPVGSPDALAVLALANDTSRSQSFYVTECGLSESQAAVIVGYRAGDEPGSTLDDKSFASLQQLDDLPFTDAGFWNLSLACAKRLAPPVVTPPEPAPLCTQNTCATAFDLGTVSGDLGADVTTVTGAGARWLKVRVSEDDSSFLAGRDLSLKATLTSPPGHNFDLFVYRADTDVLACTAPRASSTSSSSLDTATVRWGEGAQPNGVDNSRTVTIEVRDADPTSACDPSAKWKLKVEGYR